MDKEILETLKEMSQAQKDILARQEETLAFLRAEAEKTKKIREESIALQRQAAERVKGISLIAFPAILLCVALLVYLIVKYRIL